MISNRISIWKILIISYKMAIIWMPEYLVMVIKSAFRNSQASIWTNVGQPLEWNLNLEIKIRKIQILNSKTGMSWIQ